MIQYKGMSLVTDSHCCRGCINLKVHFRVIAGLLFKNYYVILKGPNKFTSFNKYYTSLVFRSSRLLSFEFDMLMPDSHRCEPDPILCKEDQLSDLQSNFGSLGEL